MLPAARRGEAYRERPPSPGRLRSARVRSDGPARPAWTAGRTAAHHTPALVRSHPSQHPPHPDTGHGRMFPAPRGQRHRRGSSDCRARTPLCSCRRKGRRLGPKTESDSGFSSAVRAAGDRAHQVRSDERHAPTLDRFAPTVRRSAPTLLRSTRTFVRPARGVQGSARTEPRLVPTLERHAPTLQGSARDVEGRARGVRRHAASAVRPPTDPRSMRA